MVNSKNKKLGSADFYFINAKNHDKNMAIIQSLRYFTTFVYGFFLKKENLKLDQLINLSSSIYHFKLSIVVDYFLKIQNFIMV